jgi:hypothetical protein
MRPFPSILKVGIKLYKGLLQLYIILKGSVVIRKLGMNFETPFFIF